MPEQVTKASILKELSTGYTALEELLASLDEKDYLKQGITPDWSIKDILAHINSWHHRLLSLLNTAIHNEEPPLAGPDSVEELDKLNAQFYQQNKSLPLNQVLADFHTSYQHIFDITQVMPEEDLINPQQFSWTHGQPLWQSIAGDTYEHYQEHLIQIQQWLTKSEQI